MTTLLTNRAGSPCRIFLLTAGWGLAMGAIIGGGTGLILGVLALASAPAFFPAAALGGLVYGLAVALVPSLVGAGVVTAILASRHRAPADPDAIRRDLTWIFASIICGLELLGLLAAAASGDASFTGGLLVAFLVLDLVLLPLLLKARSSITRAWTGIE